MIAETQRLRDARGVPVTREGIDYGPLQDLIGFWIRRTEVGALLSFRSHLAEWDVSPAQAATLIIIEGNPGLTQIALAGALATDQSMVVSLVDRLEERAFVARTRAANDRRYQVLSLTKSGGKVVNGVKAALRRHHAFLMSALSEEESRTLMGLLCRFVEG